MSYNSKRAGAVAISFFLSFSLAQFAANPGQPTLLSRRLRAKSNIVPIERPELHLFAQQLQQEAASYKREQRRGAIQSEAALGASIDFSRPLTALGPVLSIISSRRLSAHRVGLSVLCRCMKNHCLFNGRAAKSSALARSLESMQIIGRRADVYTIISSRLVGKRANERARDRAAPLTTCLKQTNGEHEGGGKKSDFQTSGARSSGQRARAPSTIGRRGGRLVWPHSAATCGRFDEHRHERARSRLAQWCRLRRRASWAHGRASWPAGRLVS